MLTNQSDSFIKQSSIAPIIAMLAVTVMLEMARSVHYLFFHTMVEVFAVIVSLSIFILTWTSHRYLSGGYLVMLGAAYGAIGLVDVFHALTFKGMNLFPGVTLNFTNQFWLTARFLEAVALLCAPLTINRKPDFLYTSAAFFMFATVACVAVVYQWFPATYIEGIGLSPFKIYSEYVIITIMAVGLILLIQRKSQFEPKIFRLLTASLLLAIAAETCFTQYVGFYDLSHALGHYFRFSSVILAFAAIVISGVREPLAFQFREINDRQQKLEILNSKLAESEAHLKLAQHVGKMGSWHFDIPESKLTWSEEIYRMFGEPLDKTISFEVFTSHIHPDDLAAVLSTWDRALQGAPYDIEHRVRVRDGVRWVNEVAEVTFSPSGTPLFAMGTVQDITERKQMEEQIRNLAFYDTLTQLPNRRLLNDRLDHAMSASKRSGHYGALMFLDLDNFKPLNDLYGHAVGDSLLIEVARRISGCVRAVDTVARFGGDEFVVILNELDVDKAASTAQASIVAEKIRAALAESYLLTIHKEGNAENTVEHRCTSSIGVVVFINHEEKPDDLLKLADAAMYKAKESGRNQICFNDADT